MEVDKDVLGVQLENGIEEIPEGVAARRVVVVAVEGGGTTARASIFEVPARQDIGAVAGALVDVIVE